jgi:hypothetical protein
MAANGDDKMIRSAIAAAARVQRYRELDLAGISCGIER